MDFLSSEESSSPVPRARKIPDKPKSQTVNQRPTPPSEPSSATPLPRSIMNFESGSIGPSQQAVKSTRKARFVKTAKPHVTSKLIGAITISFLRPEERIRATGDLLPPFAYRTSGEKSGTLSRYQPKECHAKSRDIEHLVLLEGNAFQNHEDFNASRDMNPQRIIRQYTPQMRRDPSSYVSAYHTEEEALEKANRFYYVSRDVQQRLTIAQIDFTGLIPATMHGELQTYSATYKGKTINTHSVSEKTRPVKYPVWIRDTARPADGSSITIQQFYDSGADMWMRGLEMRKTGKFDMNCGAAYTHDNEWLCCGAIPESCIKNVMPFDGEKLHHEKGYEFVQSKKSIETYIFNFDNWIWDHNPDTTDYRPYRLPKVGDKRFAPDDDEDEDGDEDDADDYESEC